MSCKRVTICFSFLDYNCSENIFFPDAKCVAKVSSVRSSSAITSQLSTITRSRTSVDQVPIAVLLRKLICYTQWQILLLLRYRINFLKLISGSCDRAFTTSACRRRHELRVHQVNKNFFKVQCLSPLKE